MFTPALVDHLVFRVSDMNRTARFYTALLGEPFRAEDYVMYMVGSTRLFFTPCVKSMEPYDKDKIGLNHIAFRVQTMEELARIASELTDAGIAHSGMKLWQDQRTRYIWLDDPDGIRIEYWLRVPEEAPAKAGL